MTLQQDLNPCFSNQVLKAIDSTTELSGHTSMEVSFLRLNHFFSECIGKHHLISFAYCCPIYYCLWTWNDFISKSSKHPYDSQHIKSVTNDKILEECWIMLAYTEFN